MYKRQILNNSPSFLFFQHGDFTLTVRIGASFCEHRTFVPAALAPKDGGYALHQTMTGWYYLPFAEKPATSDWWQMAGNTSRSWSGAGHSRRPWGRCV